jgi:hypothetical protein
VARPDLGNTRTTLFCGGGAPIGLIRDGKVVAGDRMGSQDSYLFAIISNKVVDAFKEYWSKYGIPNFTDKGLVTPTLHFADVGAPQFDK